MSRHGSFSHSFSKPLMLLMGIQHTSRLNCATWVSKWGWGQGWQHGRVSGITGLVVGGVGVRWGWGEVGLG